MKHLSYLFIACFTLVGFTTMAQTNVGGALSTNTTWTLANSPYTVTSSVTVNIGVTLTVESGVEVKFNTGTNVKVLGTLTANGATFTSLQESPAAGDWLGISGGNTTGGSTEINLTDCQIQYAVDGIYLNEGRGFVTLTNSSITNCSQYGIEGGNIYLDSESTVTATNLTISNIGANYPAIYGNKTVFDINNSNITGGSIAIHLNGTHNTVPTDTSSVNNTSLSSSLGTGLYLQNNAHIKLSGNTITGNNYPITYGNRSQLIIESANTYSGNTYNYIRFEPSTFQVDGDMTVTASVLPYLFSTLDVNAGATLTIEEGAVFKSKYYGQITVKGQLNVNGTSDKKVTFTSESDDTVIGDTNGDGNNSTADGTRWYGITFEDGSSAASSINYANIHWAKLSSAHGAISCFNSSPTITNCNITNAQYGAYFRDAAGGTFSNNTIGSSEITPVAMSFEANPTFSNNTFSTSDNQYDAIGLLGGTMTTSGSITQRDFTDIPNVTYVLLSSITVPDGITLTINPGVVIKALSGQEIKVEGTLNATGASDAPVVFTSVNDDNFGNPNDTRNDGNDQIPAIGNFGGFYFTETSVNSVLDSALIKFANNRNDFDPNAHGNQYYDGAVSISGTDVTINDATITDANYGIVMRNSASAISNTEIVNTVKAPLRISLSSTPTITDLTFTSVGWKGIAILDEYVTYNASLGKRNVAGLDNITYIMTGLRIENGAQVTINKGLNIKMDIYNNIDVYGGLKIAGTLNEPIIFTSLADDNVGASSDPTENDTEGNGNSTDPNSRKWGGILFQGTSDDAFSSVEHAEFWYGGYNKAPITHINAAAPVSNVTIKYAYAYGMYFENNSTPLIDSVFIQSSASDPIAISFFANPTFTRMSFDANSSNGLRLIESVLSSNATVRKRDIAGINNIAYILGSLDVNSGATLNVQPGVVFKLPSSQINVYDGRIVAVGTTSEKIIFTSTADDSRGGDTNNDGNGSVPNPGHWGGIDTYSTALQSHFQYCEFRYGGSGQQGGYPKYEPYRPHLSSQDNNLLVEDCLIQLNSSMALGSYGTSTATYRRNRIENLCNSCSPVHMSMFANPTFTGNTVENIGRFAIEIRDETFTQNATMPFRSFAGVDSITYIISDINIASGTTITIPAGMIFKHGTIDVEGNLQVLGTESDPVVFTSLSDDTYGRPLDTELNGEPNSHPRGSQYGDHFIDFYNISDDNSLVEYTIFRNGGIQNSSNSNGAIKLQSASPTIRNNTFIHCDEGIACTGLSQPKLANNLFKDLDRAPFSTSIVAFPATMEGNQIEGSTWKGIRIVDETLTQDTTLVRRTFAGNDNIPYIFGAYTIGTGVKLSVDPGLVLKFGGIYYGSNNGYSGSMRVYGSLDAQGNADSTIVFTELADDFYGGDTYTTRSPSLNYGTVRGWSGITFENESSDALSNIAHSIVKRGTYGIKLNSASPTLSEIAFIENDNFGIDMSGASNPIITSCDFIDNGQSHESYGAVNNTGSFTVDVTGSWWGKNSGPYHATLNPTGTGQNTFGALVIDPWTTDNSLNPVTGDISLNGRVTAFDAALGLQSVASLITLNDRQTRAADVSGNETISAMDASYILQFAAGLITWFPAEAENKRVDQEWVSTYSDIEVTLEPVEVEDIHSTLEIPLYVNNVKDLYAFESIIELDEQLEFISFQQEGWLETSLVSNFIEDKNEVRLTFAEINAKQQDALLGTLILEIKEGTTAPELKVALNKVIGNESNVTNLATSATVRVLANVLNAAQRKELSIYPNPIASEVTVIPAFQGSYLLEMIDLKGATVYRINASGELHLNVSELGLENGTYILRLSDGQKSFEEKLIINQ